MFWQRRAPLQQWARHTLVWSLESYSHDFSICLVQSLGDSCDTFQCSFVVLCYEVWFKDRIHSFALHLSLFCLIEEYALASVFCDSELQITLIMIMLPTNAYEFGNHTKVRQGFLGGQPASAGQPVMLGICCVKL